MEKILWVTGTVMMLHGDDTDVMLLPDFNSQRQSENATYNIARPSFTRGAEDDDDVSSLVACACRKVQNFAREIENRCETENFIFVECPYCTFNFAMFTSQSISPSRKSLERNGVVNQQKLLVFLTVPVLVLFIWIFSSGNQDPNYRIQIPSSDEVRAQVSGWNAQGMQLYKDQAMSLSCHDTRTIRIPPLGDITVRVNPFIMSPFWDLVDGVEDWEPETFAIFRKYVTSETIVVDFGTWIGPTVLYHSQLSRRSYGIEADPVAYASLEANVKLNPHLPITITPACVSTPEDVGIMKMKGDPGNSMSGLSDKLFGTQTNDWDVQCYYLPTILKSWGVNVEKQPMVIKVDVESYECRLIPSFYNWLKDKKRLPTLFISFHPQIRDCSDEAWDGALKVFRLYNRVYSHSGEHVLPASTYASLEAFRNNFNTTSRDSVFLLEGHPINPNQPKMPSGYKTKPTTH